jgi:hypothetical protein
MGRAPCCDERVALKKGPWTPDEDLKLVAYVQEHGHGSWRALPEKAGTIARAPPSFLSTLDRNDSFVRLPSDSFSKEARESTTCWVGCMGPEFSCLGWELGILALQGWRGAARAVGCGGRIICGRTSSAADSRKRRTR